MKQDLAGIEEVVVGELIRAGLSQNAALALVGIAASKWHYRRYGRAGSGTNVPHTERSSDSWLTEQERAEIKAKLDAAGTQVSVYQAYHEALDEGDPIASLSSWHRIARVHRATDRQPRAVTRTGATATPCLQATGPMQVWTWDITLLPGPHRGTWFHLYLAIDLFSRQAVAYRVEEGEDEHLAAEMFASAFTRHGARPQVVHADGGAAMRSKTLQQLFIDLEVLSTRSRPGVSNDNPFSESVHKTIKYRPWSPAHFDSLEHARAWAEQVLDWYNTIHRHRGLEGHTPSSVHDGSWAEISRRRQATVDRLFAANPTRYSRRPIIKTPRAAVGINTRKIKDRLTTG